MCTGCVNIKRFRENGITWLLKNRRNSFEERQRGEMGGRRTHTRRERGEGFQVGVLKLLGHTPTSPLYPSLSLTHTPSPSVVVVADGGQSLPYCHSPRRGQITSEYCLAGQVQKPLTPPHPHYPPSADSCISTHMVVAHKVRMCDWWVCVFSGIGGGRAVWAHKWRA